MALTIHLKTPGFFLLHTHILHYYPAVCTQYHQSKTWKKYDSEGHTEKQNRLLHSPRSKAILDNNYDALNFVSSLEWASQEKKETYKFASDQYHPAGFAIRQVKKNEQKKIPPKKIYAYQETLLYLCKHVFWCNTATKLFFF